jgi:hypothetical protein
MNEMEKKVDGTTTALLPVLQQIKDVGDFFSKGIKSKRNIVSSCSIK